ncbi:MAG: hypothetical protein WDZ52_12570 [Pseudohongiellaceae bacterium]
MNVRMGSLSLAAVLAVALVPISLDTAAQESSAAGLIQENGWQLVRDNCTECHSSQIIVQNSGNREVWKSRIEWMQDSQGLGELEAEVEATILDYLATNYGQKATSRRAALPQHLMPSNVSSQAN